MTGWPSAGYAVLAALMAQDCCGIMRKALHPHPQPSFLTPQLFLSPKAAIYPPLGFSPSENLRALNPPCGEMHLRAHRKLETILGNLLGSRRSLHMPQLETLPVRSHTESLALFGPFHQLHRRELDLMQWEALRVSKTDSKLG